MIKTIGVRNLLHCICNIMPFVAAVAFVIYQKVHLLLGDIAVIATEGDEWCLGGQNYTTVISSTKIHTQKETRAGDQKPKINLEWRYNMITLHFSCRIDGLQYSRLSSSSALRVGWLMTINYAMHSLVVQHTKCIEKPVWD